MNLHNMVYLSWQYPYILTQHWDRPVEGEKKRFREYHGKKKNQNIKSNFPIKRKWIKVSVCF